MCLFATATLTHCHRMLDGTTIPNKVKYVASSMVLWYIAGTLIEATGKQKVSQVLTECGNNNPKQCLYTVC